MPVTRHPVRGALRAHLLRAASPLRAFVRALSGAFFFPHAGVSRWNIVFRRHCWYVVEIDAECRRSPAYCLLRFYATEGAAGIDIPCRLEPGRIGKAFAWMPVVATTLEIVPDNQTDVSLVKVRVGRVAGFFARTRVRRKVVGRAGVGIAAEHMQGLADGPLFDLYLRTLGQGHPAAGAGPNVQRDTALRLAQAVVAGQVSRPQGFAFPTPGDVEASVIVPVCGHYDITLACLHRLATADAGAWFEVVLVDDGSDDETQSIESVVAGIRVVRNAKPQGFVAACNAGATLARAPVLVFLNNDTIVLAGWLRGLLAAFEADPALAVAGAKLIYPDGRLQEAGCFVLPDGSVFNEGRGLDPDYPRFNFQRPVDYVSGACLAIRRAYWSSLGGFDVCYAPAYFEDADLCFRVRQRGGAVAYVPECEVVHFEGMTAGRSTGVGVKAYQVANHRKFVERWADVLATHGTTLARQRVAAYRGAVLLIDAEFPDPDRSGGGYAALREARLFRALGFRVGLSALASTDEPGVVARWQREGVEVFRAPYYDDIESVLRSHGHEFDLVVATRYYVVESAVHLVRQYSPAARLVLNLADLHYLRELREAEQRADRGGVAKADATRRREYEAMRQVDLVTSYTETERSIIRRELGDRCRVALMPWVADRPVDVPGFHARSGIAFLGGFRHPPNLDAVLWFIETVMPSLRRRRPGVRFHIYGADIPPILERFRSESVVLEGFVERPEEAYRSCRVFVAPLRFGAGIKAKVVGALANGVPVVASAVAGEGIVEASGEGCWIAGAVDEWVDSILVLHDDADAWHAASAAGFRLAQESFGEAAGQRRLGAIVDSLLKDGRP